MKRVAKAVVGVLSAVVLFWSGSAGLSWAAGSDGSVDPAFVPPSLNSIVLTMADAGDGKTLVGGYFTDAGGQAQQDNLIRLNADGSLDTTFVPPTFAAGSSVWSITPLASGKIMVGGYFQNVDGNADADFLIRIAADGALDTSFIPSSGTKPQLNNAVYAIHPLSDGSVVVGGAFTQAYGSFSNQYLVRMDASGSLSSGWTATSRGAPVWAVSELPGGDLMVGGDNSFLNNLQRITTSGSLVGSAIAVGGPVRSFAPTSDGGLIVVGGMQNVGGVADIDHVARLNEDGSLDTSFIPARFTAFSDLRAITITDSGQLIVGGDFTSVDGSSEYSRLARLNADGSLDETFVPLSLNSVATSVLLTGVSSGIVGGYFTAAAGDANLNYVAGFQTPPLESSAPDAPRAPLQQYGRAESEGCTSVLPDETDFPALSSMKPDAWGESWAWWPNEGTGGFVCTRQPYFTAGGTWAVR